MDSEISKLNQKIQQDALFIQDLRKEMAKVVIGQEDLINSLLTGLIANGHVLEIGRAHV